MKDHELFNRLKNLLGKWHDIPDERGYGGTGAPGRLLETLLGINGGNEDLPDSGKWEIKFHGGKSLLTLFHKEALPAGHMHQLVQEFGIPDKLRRLSFRHTIHGRSKLGFEIVSESEKILVRNPQLNNLVTPYWTHDTLMSAFASKLRRLIVVEGQKKKQSVFYAKALIYQDPLPTALIKAVASGLVAIDFDARTEAANNDKNTSNRGLRNHGTKFRISYENLTELYNKRTSFPNK